MTLSAHETVRFGWRPSDDTTAQMPSIRFRANSRMPTAAAPAIDFSHAVELAEIYGPTKGTSPIFDQGPSSSCVAQAGSMAVRTKLFVQAMLVQDPAAQKAAYEAVDAPARLFGYQAARRVTKDDAYDDGTFLQSWMDAAHRVGLPRENDPDLDLAWDASRVLENVVDGMAAQHAGHDHRILEASHRIDDGRPKTEVKELVRTVLSNLDPVIFGIALCSRFQTLQPGQIYRREAGLIGYHAMGVIGYDHRGVKVVNSWSRRFCDNGYAWISWDYFLESASDIHVLDLAVPYVR